MRRENLEHFLNQGHSLGFVKSTDNPQFLGWILLQRMDPDDRYFGASPAREEPEYVAQQELYRSHPYQVRVIELDRDVFDSDRYETGEDYRMHERHYFASLDEVEEFVARFGQTLVNIKWLSEIDAP